MSINADLRDRMIDIYEQHKSCADIMSLEECSVGSDFMEAMEGWLNQ